MKKTRADLLADAIRLMKAHKEEKIFATCDGNFFLRKHDRDYHNQTLKENDELPEAFDFQLNEKEIETTAPADEANAKAEAAAKKKAASDAKKEEAEKKKAAAEAKKKADADAKSEAQKKPAAETK